MTSKERMLVAINREKPDRLPVTVHQWQPYHLNTYMNGMSDLEAFRAVGLDASITVYEEVETESRNWKVTAKTGHGNGYEVIHYTIETPEGILTTAEGRTPMTSWVTEHLIKREEDIQLLRKYRPIPKLDQEKVAKAYTELGDSGILRTFVWGKQGGCWQDACELFGVEPLIMATFDKPEWVHEFLEILLEQKLKYIEESISGMPFDLVETGGGASSNTVISPAIHEEFCLPYDIRMHDALKREGMKTVYHTCGGMTKILDCIIQNHCDVSETLSPSAMGGDIRNSEDGRMVQKKLHPYVGMIGGMDQFHILEEKGETEIAEEVKRLFEVYGMDGGYILSACDHFFHVPPQNLKAFAKAAKQYQYEN